MPPPKKKKKAESRRKQKTVSILIVLLSFMYFVLFTVFESILTLTEKVRIKNVIQRKAILNVECLAKKNGTECLQGNRSAWLCGIQIIDCVESRSLIVWNTDNLCYLARRKIWYMTRLWLCISHCFVLILIVACLQHSLGWIRQYCWNIFAKPSKFWSRFFCREFGMTFQSFEREKKSLCSLLFRCRVYDVMLHLEMLHCHFYALQHLKSWYGQCHIPKPVVSSDKHLQGVDNMKQFPKFQLQIFSIFPTPFIWSLATRFSFKIRHRNNQKS